jgi:hypothetical protein
MNRDDIIRMAREAEAWNLIDHDGIAALERFAALVAAEWQEKCNTYIQLHDAVVKDSDRLYAAVANLIRVKGRHNTELAYQRLIAAYDKRENND